MRCRSSACVAESERPPPGDPLCDLLPLHIPLRPQGHWGSVRPRGLDITGWQPVLYRAGASYGSGIDLLDSFLVNAALMSVDLPVSFLAAKEEAA